MLAALTITSCRDTQQPIPVTPPGNAWDPGVTSLTFKVETPEGEASALRLIATDITWAPDSGILRAQVALHNSGTESILGPSAVEVFDFLPAGVRTLNAVCGIIPQAPCFYEYTGTYGDDDRLEPGETSATLEWQILNPRGEGFSFRARLLRAPDPGGRIEGVVFNDRNHSGRRNLNEPGIADVFVSLGPTPARVVSTDDQGRFVFHVGAPGIYTLMKRPELGWESTTPEEMQVVVFRDSKGKLSNYLTAAFGCTRSDAPGIGGTVFLDENRNGERDPNEAGLEFIVVSLAAFPPDVRTGEPCEAELPLVFPPRLPSSTVSGRDGIWFLPTDDVTCDPPWLIQRGSSVGMAVQIPPPPPLLGTTPRDQVVVAIPDPPGRVMIDFGVAHADTSRAEPILVVDGRVFVDSNENGVHDFNEQYAPGVRLDLLSPCDRLESTWTNYLGYYRFEPPATEFCDINGVAVAVSADRVTTTNPVMFPPPSEPGLHRINVDFGVRP